MFLYAKFNISKMFWILKNYVKALCLLLSVLFKKMMKYPFYKKHLDTALKLFLFKTNTYKKH